MKLIFGEFLQFLVHPGTQQLNLFIFEEIDVYGRSKLLFHKQQRPLKQSDNALRSETDPVSRATSWPIGWVVVYKQDCMIVWMTRHRYKIIR